MPTEIAITELLEIDPTRVDAVGSPANGTEWLMLKAIDDEIVETAVTTEEVVEAITKDDGSDDGDDGDCSACDGSGKADDGSKCPTCRGTGIAPKVGQTEKELLATAKQAHLPPVVAKLVADTKEFDEALKTAKASIDALKASALSGAPTMPADTCPTCKGGGNIDDGTADGKVCPDCEGSGHDGQFPPDDALHRVDGFAGSSDNGNGRLTIDKELAESDEPVEKDGVVSGDNPFMGGSITSADDSVNTPGSPAWESVDADCATQAAQFLMQAADLIATFSDREKVEVAAGEGNDLFDSWDAECALDAVTAALGVMARLAFHEGVSAQKSVDESDVVEKRGKRLSTKSVTALAAARDHINVLLGDDDPAKSNDDASKSEKDILDMTADELTKLLDERDEARAAKEQASTTKVKKDKKVAVTEVVAAATEDGATEVVATEDGTDATKAADETGTEAGTEVATKELTPEEIEANEDTERLRKELKAAKKVKKQAAANAALTGKIEEHLAKVVEQNTILNTTVEELRTELEGVKKMAAPSAAVKARPQDAINKQAERDTTQFEIDRLERIAKETTDKDVREGNLDRAKELRASLTGSKS